MMFFGAMNIINLLGVLFMTTVCVMAFQKGPKPYIAGGESVSLLEGTFGMRTLAYI